MQKQPPKKRTAHPVNPTRNPHPVYPCGGWVLPNPRSLQQPNFSRKDAKAFEAKGNTLTRECLHAPPARAKAGAAKRSALPKYKSTKTLVTSQRRNYSPNTQHSKYAKNAAAMRPQSFDCEAAKAARSAVTADHSPRWYRRMSKTTSHWQ